MEYYIIKADNLGYVGRFYRNNEGKIYSCDYTNDGLMAIKCPICDTWFLEKLKLEIEDYLESKNISYEIHKLDYSIHFYYRPERNEE